LAEAAHAASAGLRNHARLVDGSHFGVSIRVCPACSQRYVSVFAETFDWTDGDDPQYSTLLPITEAEAAALERSGSEIEAVLKAVGPAEACGATIPRRGHALSHFLAPCGGQCRRG